MPYNFSRECIVFQLLNVECFEFEHRQATSHLQSTITRYILLPQNFFKNCLFFAVILILNSFSLICEVLDLFVKNCTKKSFLSKDFHFQSRITLKLITLLETFRSKFIPLSTSTVISNAKKPIPEKEWHSFSRLKHILAHFSFLVYFLSSDKISLQTIFFSHNCEVKCFCD